MKKKILLLLETIIIFSSTGCGNASTVKYINKKLNMDICGCNIVANSDEHGGFHGDGDYYVELECLDNSKNIIKQLYSWNELPLSENLQLIMYGGEKDGITYGYELAKKRGIPEIKNGYYLFIDRHSESKDIHSDIDLFSRCSFNFTIALYDVDSNTLYYYEFDT